MMTIRIYEIFKQLVCGKRNARVLSVEPSSLTIVADEGAWGICLRDDCPCAGRWQIT